VGVLVAVFAMSARVSVYAQPVFDGFATSTAMIMMHEQVRNQMMGIEEEERSASSSQKHGRQPSVTTAVTAQALSFTPSLARRKANFAQFVANSLATDPAGAAQLEQLFATTTLLPRSTRRSSLLACALTMLRMPIPFGGWRHGLQLTSAPTRRRERNFRGQRHKPARR
jgi:hypothetical protein